MSVVYCFLQGLLKKHEAFETDFQVHRDRCAEIKKEGHRLIDEVMLLQSLDVADVRVQKWPKKILCKRDYI